MVLNNIQQIKKRYILEFFKTEFNLNLEKYDHDEINLIINEINSEIEKKIKEEQEKYKNLSLELEQKQLKLMLFNE